MVGRSLSSAQIVGTLEALVVGLALLVCGTGGLARAQEEFFKPPIEAPPTKTPVGGTEVYSFLRYESDFRSMCAEMELEGRRARIVQIAEGSVEREKTCVTCRSFWKMVISACGRLGPKPTRIPTRTPSSRGKKGESSEVAKGAESAEVSAPESAPTPASPALLVAPTKASLGERTPSVALVDLASRLSARAYEVDSGGGPTQQMFENFAKDVRETKGLTVVEREYYDTLLSYLLASWEGRVDHTKLPTPTPESHALFDLFDY